MPACDEQTDGQTHDDSIYRASKASRGNETESGCVSVSWFLMHKGLIGSGSNLASLYPLHGYGRVSERRSIKPTGSRSARRPYAAAKDWRATSTNSRTLSTNFRGTGLSPTNDFWRQKTRVPVLSRGVVCVILRLAALKQYRRVTDTQTDKTHADG